MNQIVGTLNQLFVVVGILVANVLGLDKLLGTSAKWPVHTGFILIPLVISLGLIFFTESPKYLFVNCNNEEKAQEGERSLLHRKQEYFVHIK